MKNTITIQKAKGSKFARIILAGILGTIAFNGVMYADITITGIPLDIPEVMGNLAVGESEHSQTIGHAIHFANGIGLTLFFGYVVLPISKKIKKIKKLPVIALAITFAIIETIILVWFVMLPMLGAGVAGIGIAPEVSMMTLIRHIVFGTVIGIVLRKESTK